MGIIQRQGINLTIINYIGVVLGAVNMLFIYPKILSSNEFGIFKFVTQTAQMLFPFALLGVSSISIRFFPNFKNEHNGHNGFLTLLLGAASTGLALFSILVYFFYPIIKEAYTANFGEYVQYLPYLVPITCCMGLISVLSGYSSNFQRMVVPQSLNNLFIKLCTGALCLALFAGWLNFSNLMLGLAFSYLLVLALIVLYLKRERLFFLTVNPDFIRRPLLKTMGGYMIFGFFGNISTALALQIDAFMVGTMIDLKSVATYSIGFFIADTIDIPRRSIETAASPVLAQAWKDNNITEIKNIYKKSSLNLLLAGLFILLGIWLSVDNLFEIMPNGEKYMAGKYVILFLGFGKIMDLATGVNAQIIGYSSYFRFNFYAILALACFNIFCNLLLIPHFQLIGAALATMVALTLFNLLKLSYIYYRWHLQPFSRGSVVILAIGAGSYTVAYFLPDVLNPMANLILKSFVFAILYIGAALLFNVSPDMSNLVKGYIQKIRNYYE